MFLNSRRLRRFIAAAIAATLACASGVAASATDNKTAAALVAPPGLAESIAQVQARKHEAYRDVLQRFDAAIAAAPEDAALAVRRCEFMQSFIDEEYGDFVESAPADFEACSEGLEAHADAPDVRLFQLDQQWGEDGVKAGEAQLEDSEAWPSPMRARLLATLSQLHESEGNEARSGQLAVEAVQLGHADRAAEAVQYLASRRKYKAAGRLLTPLPPSDNQWSAASRIEAALNLPEASVALAELTKYEQADFEIDKTLAGRVHLHAGDYETASALLGEAEGDSAATTEARFTLAMATKNYPQAASFVTFNDAEQFAANLRRFATLLGQSPASILHPKMLVAMIVCMVLLLFVALMPGALLIPAHYRGLMRRARNDAPPALFEAVGLRHAWLGLLVSLTLPLLVGAFVAPDVLSNLIEGVETAPESAAFFRWTLWSTALGLALVLLVAHRMGPRHLIGHPRVLLGNAVWVIAAWVGLMAIGMMLALIHSGSGGAETLQTKSVDAMTKGGMEFYGPATTLLLMAVMVPILEEITFRGLLLGGLTRHIGFGWANLAQALLFAAFHDDLPRFPYYFALGLFAGWLVKRSRSLGPAILLHGLNNAVAAGLKML